MTVVRDATVADAPALVPLFEDWSHPLAADAIAERLRVWAGEPRGRVLVAEVDGEVVGIAGVAATPHLARPGSFARLIGLAVRATHQRRGIGAALIAAAEEQARAWGCERLELTMSRWREAAPAFYEARGYEDLSARQARFAREL